MHELRIMMTLGFFVLTPPTQLGFVQNFHHRLSDTSTITSHVFSPISALVHKWVAPISIGAVLLSMAHLYLALRVRALRVPVASLVFPFASCSESSILFQPVFAPF
jgi:hypothetical protein